MAPSTPLPKKAGFPPLSSSLITATKVLSIVRVAVGGACFFAPQLTCSLHHYHVPAPYLLFVRMMGAREAINGALLYTARDENENDGGRRLVSVVNGRADKHVRSNIVIEVLVGPSGLDF